MSEKDKNAADGVASEKKLRVAKKVAAVLLVASTAAAVVILLANPDLGSQRGGIDENGFLVALDNPTTATAHFMIATKPGNAGQPGEDVQQADDGSLVLVGKSLGNAWPTQSVRIRQYYDSLLKEKGLEGGLSGSANCSDPDTGMPAALVYTFYLNNVSESETQKFRVAARLTHDRGQAGEAKGVDVYEYIRLAMFMGDDGAEDDDWYFFANKSNREALETDHSDYRECLSKWGKSEYSAEEINAYRRPLYTDQPSGISVCEMFEPGSDPEYQDRGLFDVQDLEIRPGASRRITFLAYLEGDDPDCNGEPPQNQKIGFSLHVGV